VNQTGFEVPQSRCNVTSHAEVRILIDCTRDQALHIRAISKDVREGSRKRRSRLNRRKPEFPHAVCIAEPKDLFHLVRQHQFVDPQNNRIHVAQIVDVRKYEGFLDVEPNSDDVLHVLPHVLAHLLERHVFPKVLLIVRHLTDQGNIEGVL